MGLPTRIARLVIFKFGIIGEYEAFLPHNPPSRMLCTILSAAAQFQLPLAVNLDVDWLPPIQNPRYRCST